MKSFYSFPSKVILAALTTVALTGCESGLQGFFNSLENQAAAPTDTAASSPAAPAVSPAPAQANPPAAQPAAAAQAIRCETPNYYADVAIENNQPVMSFVRKPGTVSLNKAPATRTNNADGSVTFAASGEQTFYSRLYSNATCFLQTVGSNGVVGFEENGQIKR